MREKKHSKKLAFAVLAAVAAVGSIVAPVSAAPVTTADGFISAAGNATASPAPSNAVSYGVVANGTATSIAVGQGNTITSANGSSSAYGNQNTIDGNQANAFGDGNKVTGEFAQAFGDTNDVNGTNAIGYGYNNTVGESTSNFRDRDYDNEPDGATLRPGDWRTNSVAIGSENTALGSSALAVGNGSQAKMSEAIAIGHAATAERTWSTAIGTRANASEVRAQAIGYEAAAAGYKANAIGSSAKATGAHTNAIGSSAIASGDHAQAYGAGAQAEGVRANAFGSDAHAKANYAMAIGDHSVATDANSVAIGYQSQSAPATSVNSASVMTTSITSGAPIATHTYSGFAEISATSTDAVNGSQLFSVAKDLQNQIDNSTPGQINNNITNLNSRVGAVEKRVNKVGAGSAALAALHPLDFNPDDKWTIAAGYGHYHNANSAALGAFYRPNEDTMFSVGGTVGTGETQLNAGVSLRLGKRSPESRSRVAMGREIAELNARLQDMENKYNNLLQILNPLAIDPSKTAEFPDVPQNHWAYQYISQLAGNGILVGYPDGTFKGDAKMTRYEFATMLYRALQNGAPIDENMKRAMNEFGPELQNIRLNHFRIDRISGGDNDRHKTERVRVNNEPENQRDVYGSRIYK